MAKARGARAKMTNKRTVSRQKPLVVKSNGALRAAAGVTSSGKVNLTNARKLARGKGINAQRANFFLNVLRKK